jgi:hypothetical protein
MKNFRISSFGFIAGHLSQIGKATWLIFWKKESDVAGGRPVIDEVQCV